jgi:hypothetical protein
MYGELLCLRRSILMCGRRLSMFWTCYIPLQVSRSGGLILTHLNLVSLMHSGYGHLKVEVLYNVMESFVELYLFTIGFQLECLLHSVPGVRQLLEVHSCRWSTEEVVPCQTRLQDDLGSENGTKVQLVKVTCKFKLYKLSSILHVIELARDVRV